MGCAVNARCACGYARFTLMIGGGIRNYAAFCSFPVYCLDCRSLSLANLLAGTEADWESRDSTVPRGRVQAWTPQVEPPAKREKGNSVPTCGECGSAAVVPYDAKELVKVKGREVAFWWPKGVSRPLVLTDGLYYCPQCKSHRMTFETNRTHWD